MSRPIPAPLALSAAVALLAAACSANPAPVPVAAGEAELSALAGEWRGEYRAEETGRSGGILFVVEPGRDTAHGDVLMVPPDAELPRQFPREAGRPGARPADRAGAGPQPLRIAFVRLAGGEVRGMLEPYEAPDCRCIVRTEFTGRLAGDRIEGRFVTTGEELRRVQRGWWRVERQEADGPSH